MLGYIFYKLKTRNFFIFVVILSSGLYIFQTIFTWVGNEEDEKNYPLIIWWTPFMAKNEKVITCLNKYRCILTADRNNVNNANLQAYLFYGSSLNLSDLPVPKNKIWAIFHEESPRNVAVLLYQQTYDLFDFIATFSRNSDFPLTLQYLENISIITDTRYFVKVEDKNKLLNQIAPVLYIQSDCDTPVERDKYVKELMDYVQIDSYGICLNNKKFPSEIAQIPFGDLYNHKLLHFISKYKFVIAFENAICDDYITEKLWRPLIVGAVPIYRGSPSVEDWLPNKNSAILADSFVNMKQLGNFINKLNDNDTLYNTFFEHKYGKIENEFLKSMLSKGPFGVANDQEHPIFGFECSVCQMIYEGHTKQHFNSVYNCLKPKTGNSWEYHWRHGECLSRMLADLVHNNRSLKANIC